MEDQWDDQPRQWLRSTRKLLFLPASSEVRTLSTIISSLILLTKSHTSSSNAIASVVITYPALPGLYAEDISDAALYLSLPLLPGNHGYPPRTIVCAYAGHGMGLCSSYFDRKKCTEEGLNLPIRSTILVDYAAAALLLQTASIREAYDLADSYANTLTYLSSPRDNHNLDDVDQYSKKQKVRKMVIDLLRTGYKRFPGPPGPPKMITVLLVGSIADIDMDGVGEIVKGAVEAEGFEVEMFVSNTEFVAARGAAELAWRALSLATQADMEG